jgi:hypothetical protein
VGETHGTHETHETYRTHETHECIVPQREPLISQLEAAFADYGALRRITIIPCCGRDDLSSVALAKEEGLA